MENVRIWKYKNRNKILELIKNAIIKGLYNTKADLAKDAINLEKCLQTFHLKLKYSENNKMPS